MPYPPIFPQRFRGKGANAYLAGVLNRIADLVNNINGYGGITVNPNALGGLDINGLKVKGGTWTGVLWFGNDITDFSVAAEWPANVDGSYLIVNLTTGATRWADSLDELDNPSEQAFWVADPVYNTEDPPAVVGYRLNNHTQGDIHARIT